MGIVTVPGNVPCLRSVPPLPEEPASVTAARTAGEPLPAPRRTAYFHLAEITGRLNLGLLLALGLLAVLLVSLMLWYSWNPAARNGEPPSVAALPPEARLPDELWDATAQSMLPPDPAVTFPWERPCARAAPASDALAPALSPTSHYMRF